MGGRGASSKVSAATRNAREHKRILNSYIEQWKSIGSEIDLQKAQLFSSRSVAAAREYLNSLSIKDITLIAANREFYQNTGQATYYGSGDYVLDRIYRASKKADKINILVDATVGRYLDVLERGKRPRKRMKITTFKKG